MSATQKPIEEIARYLVGTQASAERCAIVDVGHVRERDLALELPPAPLEAIMSGEVWQQVYARLAALTQEHRTTLVFVNTRRMAERVARHLSELIGKDVVTAHHGSLAKERRFDAEQRLKSGQLRALVATASLELGIDIGDVELVCQLGTPRSIATFLQRAGRANHSVGGQPKARLFPLVARRARGVRGAPRRRAARRARPHCDTAEAARRACPAGRGRSGGERMERRGAVRRLHARVSLRER